MGIFDRHLLRLFTKIWFVWFVSITGLCFVVEIFTNLDEFIQISKRHGGWGTVFEEYFAPRILSFFDRTCGLFALLAAICSLALMRGNNELTALMAAGVSNRRLLKPLLVSAIVFSCLGVANREFLLPRMQEMLARNAQDWAGSRPRPLQPCYDHQTDIFLNGRSAFANDKRIEQPSFRLPRSIADFGSQISAEVAFARAASADVPAGFLFERVRLPADIAKIPSAKLGDRPVILTPLDTPWLKADQCYVVSEVDFDQLSGGAAWRQYASIAQLIRGLRNSSLMYGDDVRLEVHKRMVQPFLDITLFVLGMPLVLGRQGRGVVVSTGLCCLLLTVFFVVVLGCHALGQRGFLLSPALAAWTPLIIFVPMARAGIQPLME